MADTLPGKYGLLSRLFGRHAVGESIPTRVRFNASPETVWKRIMFYEDVPGEHPLLLKLSLPRPVRTEGDKSRVGSTILCTYDRGSLVKRITTVEPHGVEFEVVEQRLGIENCVIALGGSYEINSVPEGAEVVLTTRYRAFLRPRRLWRPLEKLLAGQLHRHILNGMRAAVAPVRTAATHHHVPHN